MPEETALATVTTDVAEGSYSETPEQISEDTQQTTEVPETQETTEQQTDRPVQPTEEPELAEFKGLVSSRLRAMVKEAPELNQVFQKYPKVQQAWEAAFRRDAAYREIFPTVQEARKIRDMLPNGAQDIEEILADRNSVDELDQRFYGRDANGKFPGHESILRGEFQDDPEATIAFLRDTALPTWAKLDHDSYNEAAVGIVDATFTGNGIPEFLAELQNEKDPANLLKGIKQLSGWVNSFHQAKPQPTAGEEKLRQDREKFNRDTQERNQQDAKTFNREFGRNNVQTENSVIGEHPAIKKMLGTQGLSKEKKDEIISEIRKRGEAKLNASPQFMRKLTPLHSARKLDEAGRLIRTAWSQPWFLNGIVRAVMAEKVPQLATRQTATPQSKPVPTNGAGKTTPSGPRQIGGRWYKADGSPFTTAEILAGKHEQ